MDFKPATCDSTGCDDSIKEERLISIEPDPLLEFVNDTIFKPDFTDAPTSQNQVAEEVVQSLLPPSIATPALTREKLVLVIAIDFGTTNSGAAYAFWSGRDIGEVDVKGIQEWPGSSKTWDKAPTVFAYDIEDEPAAKRARTSKSFSLSRKPVFKWGFEIESTDTTIEHIKLLLPKERGALPPNVRPEGTLMKLEKHGKSVENAISDYLGEIRGVIEQTLINRHGERGLEGLERRTVLTVPAIWSDGAKAATKRAAINAGFPNDLLLVSEPEAAAIWTIQKSPLWTTKVGDNYIICDAGGGTVDLISYEITQLSPLRMKESTAGSGGLCGAAFLNERFEQCVSDAVGSTAFMNFKRKNPAVWHNAMNQFEENPKRNFNPGEKPHHAFSIVCPRIPNNPKAGIKGGTIKCGSDELKEMFDPIVTDVIKLIKAQVEGLKAQRKSATAIMLVGGFGQSRYLQQCVAAQFKSKGITVLQPTDGWAAVAKGAVLWACDSQRTIESRKARFHYGISVNPKFQEGKHPESSKYFDTVDQFHRSADRFCVYIEKDATIAAASPVSHKFFADFVQGQSRRMHAKLLISSANSVPSSSNDSSLSEFCSLVTNLTVVPDHHFRDHRILSETYKRLYYEMKIQLQSGGLKFWLEVDGVEYGAVTAKFE